MENKVKCYDELNISLNSNTMLERIADSVARLLVLFSFYYENMPFAKYLPVNHCKFIAVIVLVMKCVVVVTVLFFVCVMLWQILFFRVLSGVCIKYFLHTFQGTFLFSYIRLSCSTYIVTIQQRWEYSFELLLLWHYKFLLYCIFIILGVNALLRLFCCVVTVIHVALTFVW